MRNIILNRLDITSPLKRGSINLYGLTGKKYKNTALYIPSYGWVPCSQKWQKNPTTDPKDLVLVVSEPDDDYIPVTSDIWVTRLEYPVEELEVTLD